MNARHTLPLALLIGACGTVPGSELADLSPAATEPTVDTAPPSDEPVTATQALTCLPQAIPYDLRQAPQMPADLALETLCAGALPAWPGEATGMEPSLVIAWSEEDRTLAVTDGYLRFEPTGTEFTLDAEGSVVEMHSFGAAGFYVSSYGSTWYRLNEDQELDWKFAASMPTSGAPESEWTVLVKEQTWDGDRLLGRVERDGEDGPIVRNFEWTYDGRGRLIAAEALDRTQPEYERVYSARYAYNENDRLVSLDRFVHDVLVESQAWDWEDDQLVARSFESTGIATLASLHGGESWEWMFPGGLDNYERTPTDWMSNPWPNALPRESDGCELAPQGPGHGYPTAEEEYDLSWSIDQRPSGIGFAYGNDSFGWNYGDLAWFGHAGLGSSWLGGPMLGNDVSVESRVEYNSLGQMQRESATTRVGDRSLHTDRERTFTDGLLAEDQVVFEFEGAETARVLRFERSPSGELIRRELVEGDAILAEQRWERDGSGNVVRLVVDAHEGLQPSAFDTFGQPSGFGTMQAPGGAWEWGYDSDDRVTRRASSETEQTLEYDSEGRLVEVVGTFDNALWPMRRTFDGADRLVEECTPRGADDWACQRHVRDEAGRHVATLGRDAEGAEWQVHRWSQYICVDD